MAITELARSRKQELDQALTTALEQEDVDSLEVLTEELEDTLPLFRLSEKIHDRKGQDVPLKIAVEVLESIEETHIPLQEFYIRYKEGVLSQMWEAAGKLDVAMLKPLVHTFRKVKQTEATLAEQPEIVVSREVFLRTLKELFEEPEEEIEAEEHEEIIPDYEIGKFLETDPTDLQRWVVSQLITGKKSLEELGRKRLGEEFNRRKLAGLRSSILGVMEKLKKPEIKLEIVRKDDTFSLVRTPAPEEATRLSDLLSNEGWEGHVARVLRRSGYYTVEDVSRLADRDLLVLRGFGKKSLGVLRKKLEELESQMGEA